MSSDTALLLCIMGLALVLFALELVSAEVVALGILLLLVLCGLVPADKAFAGFGSDTVIMILGLLILTAALLRTGVVEMTGRAILRRSGEDPNRILLLVMLAAATLSAFISNTAATAFFLPITVGLAQRAHLSPSRLLMPLAFASILSSSVTLVSTSTNIVVSDFLKQHGRPALGMFELAPVGLPIAVMGLGYMWFVGRRLIPERSSSGELSAKFDLHPYFTEVVIRPDSKLAGKTLEESGLGRDLDLTVLEVIRNGQRVPAPQAETQLQARDVLLVEGNREDVLKIKDTSGIDIKADVKFSDPDLGPQQSKLIEVILMPRSSLIGRTIKGSQFRERYGLQVLAINRHGGTLRHKISRIPLRMGDVLLVQGPADAVAALEGDRSLRILGQVEEKRLNLKRASTAIVLFFGALLLASLNILALHVATLLGATLAFLTRCITPEEAYREVEWKVIILIGSLLAIGAAMEETGTARYLASGLVSVVAPGEPVGLLTAFFVLTVLLTQAMSNQAAAIVVLPVALETASQAGLNPRTFAVMIAVAASCSYLTPLEPSCMMVYGAGRYRFRDFLKVGALLTVLIYLITILLVPQMWPIKEDAKPDRVISSRSLVQREPHSQQTTLHSRPALSEFRVLPASFWHSSLISARRFPNTRARSSWLQTSENRRG